MTELFDMLTTLTRRRKAGAVSPFASPQSTRKWLEKLAGGSDYDTHHALVEGLERFNAENLRADLSRLLSLQVLETTGLPLQGRIIEQYIRNQSTFRLARQALWRESWMFWSLLAEAWLTMLKAAYRGPAVEELKPHRVEIGVRALRYAGLAMRWDYHDAREPVASAWRRVHKIYQLLERDGLETQTVRLAGRATHGAREHSLIVLMGLVHPQGFRSQEIESIAQLLDSYESLPLPARTPDRNEHTHLVDLSATAGASVVDNDWMQGRRRRFLALRPLVTYLKSLDRGDASPGSLTGQVASLIERGGVHRSHSRTFRFGRVWAASGMSSVISALMRNPGSRPALESWLIRDESATGMGFALDEGRLLPPGRLIAVSWEPSGGGWQLLAVRWRRQDDGRALIGTERLSRYPKTVEICSETLPDSTAGATQAIFLPLDQEGEGMSHLLVPRTHYTRGAVLDLRDGEAMYRLRLGEVRESHEDWLRVEMDVFDRVQMTQAA